MPTPLSSSGVARRVTTFVFLTVFLDLIGYGIVLPLMPFYVQTMGGNAQTVGLILACFSAAQLVATPILGRLSDRVGRRPVILLSLAGNAISMVVFALATKSGVLWLLFASRIVAGATAGNLSACQAAIADVTTEADRAKGMGKLGAGIGLGLVLGPVAGSTVSHWGAWAPPLAAAGLALVDLIAATFLMPETRRSLSAEHRSSPSANLPLRQALVQAPIVLVMLLYFFCFLGMTNLQVALALLAKARLGWGQGEIGHVFGLFGLISFIVQGGLIGRLSAKFDEAWLVMTGSLTTASGMLLVAMAHGVTLLLAGLLLVGAGTGLTTPLLSSLASRFAGDEHKGTVLGFAQSAGGLARAIGPVLAGTLFTHMGAGAPFVGGTIAGLLALALAMPLRRSARMQGAN